MSASSKKQFFVQGGRGDERGKDPSVGGGFAIKGQLRVSVNGLGGRSTVTGGEPPRCS